ncbi:hypothetical protein ACHAW6_003759 [Cyclotella cf. meneghiniana]
MTATVLVSLLLVFPPALASTPSRNPSYTACPQVPTLLCRNGSTCIPGQAKYSASDLAALSHLQTHESGYHCDCLPGFIGHECEIAVSPCGTTSETYDPTQVTPVHSCYHGSICRRHHDDSYYCDCGVVNTKTSTTGSKYAGLMCEHEATSLCAVRLVENFAPDGQFCTNHGKCVKLVTGSDPHPGCVCRDGWDGDRCELKTLTESSVPKMVSEDGSVEGGGSHAGRWVLFTILIITMLAVGIAVIVMLIKIKREQSGPREKAVGKTAEEVGAGELEPDGSGTLGVSAVGGGDNDDPVDTEGRTNEFRGDLEVRNSVGGADSYEAGPDHEEGGDATEEHMTVREGEGRLTLEFI